VARAWRIHASSQHSGTGRIRLKIYRSTGNGWKRVGESPMATVTGWGAITTFELPAPIEVKAGDLVAWYYPHETVPSVDYSDGGATLNNHDWPWDPLPDLHGDLPDLHTKELHGPWDSNPRTYSIQLLSQVLPSRSATGGSTKGE